MRLCVCVRAHLRYRGTRQRQRGAARSLGRVPRAARVRDVSALLLLAAAVSPVCVVSQVVCVEELCRVCGRATHLSLA